MKPRLFIGSSVEQLNLAYAVQENVEHNVEPTVWTQGVFTPSRTAMASLLDQLEECDFGLFIFAPDDVTAIRDEQKRTVRDNVVFELGLFAGRLGPERCFIIVPRGQEELHLPTDLTGMTPASFDADRQDGNMSAALGPACNRILRAIQKLGPVKGEAIPETTVSVLAVTPGETLIADAGDCRALITSWMGSRTTSENLKAISFAEVDRELRLAPGSAEKFLTEAAAKYRYVVDIRGKEFIKFQREPSKPVRFSL